MLSHDSSNTHEIYPSPEAIVADGLTIDKLVDTHGITYGEAFAALGIPREDTTRVRAPLASIVDPREADLDRYLDQGLNPLQARLRAGYDA